MHAGGFEFLSDEAQAEEPAPEGVFGVVGFRPRRACRLAVQCLGAHCQAKLDVAFDLSRMERCVECAELNGARRALCGESGMQVEQVVAAVVVMPACAAPPVVGASAVVLVPKLGEGVHGGRLLPVEDFEEIGLHRLAPAFAPAVTDAKRLREEILFRVDDVHQIAQRSGRVLAEADVDVDAAGAVNLRAGFAQSADDILHHLDVFPAAHGADYLCGRIGD